MWLGLQLHSIPFTWLLALPPSSWMPLSGEVSCHSKLSLSSKFLQEWSDFSHSTSAALDIYGLDLAEPGLEMSHVGSVQSECRWVK